MKKTVFILLCTSLSMMFSSCEDKEELEDLGREAAVEFCNCYESNSLSDCLEEMKSNYSESDYMSNDFIDAFNDKSSCGVKLEKKYLSSRAYDRDVLGIQVVEW